MRSEGAARFLLSFGVGAAAGVVAALLFAPYSGRENRRRASETAGVRKDALVSLYGTYAEIPANWRNHFSSLRERFIMAVQAGREEMRRTREEWTARVNADG